MFALLRFTSVLLFSLLSLAAGSSPFANVLRPSPLSSLLPTSRPTTPSIIRADPATLTLDDPPVLSAGAQIPLSGSDWTASSPSQGLSIAGTVPGDLITDLFHAGVIPEPLYELNWLNASIWNDHTWYYNRTFTLSAAEFTQLTEKGGAGDIGLVFEGIKMAAVIYINDVAIGTAMAQFERLIFSLRAIAANASLSGAIQQGTNRLSVKLDHTISTPLFMQCTGGWDWAPYSNTTTADGREATFSRGIWKNVYLVSAPGGVLLTDIAPLITYAGPFPTEPLSDGSHAGFLLNLTLYLTVTTALPATTVVLSPSWRTTPLTLRLPAIPADSSQVGVSLLTRVSAGEVNLWWPQGLGAQPLYDIHVSLNAGARGIIEGSRRVGFRFFAIVTGNDTDAAYVAANANADGTDHQGMRFRINGAPIFVRGANVIPMDNNEVRTATHRRHHGGITRSARLMLTSLLAVLLASRVHPTTSGSDSCGRRGSAFFVRVLTSCSCVSVVSRRLGRYSAAAHRQMVLSAADGNMNILRIWGGGVFLPSIFYATADEAGVLVYHDMMNRDSFSRMQQEVNAYRNTIRRLSQHPSIAIWDGCNECNPNQGEIGTTVMTIVTSEDSSRAIWPSCPSQGWTSGVNRLSSLPNGKTLKPASSGTIEQHGPYQHGDGWPAVNGDNTHLNVFNSMLPLSLNPAVRAGLSQTNVFTSEFGSVGWSSWESIAPTIAPQHWALHGGAAKANCTGGFAGRCTPNNVMAQRNYPCDSLIVTYFGGTQADLDVVGEQPFKKQLWQCLYGQALVLKGYIEQHRATNTFGLQIWQLNEIWPTGGWGTIEYGTVELAGQVLGGRWKPAHHWLREHMFTDRLITCGADTTVRNASTLLCLIKNDLYQGVTGRVMIEAIDLGGKATTVLYEAESVTLRGGPGVMYWFTIPAVDATTTVLRATYYDPIVDEAIAHNVLLLTAPQHLQLQPVGLSVLYGPSANVDGTLDLVLTKPAGSPAAVFVTLTTLAQGRFSTNGFVMDSRSTTVQFIPFGPLDVALLKRSLRIETANQYA